MNAQTKHTPGPWLFNQPVEHAGTVSADNVGKRIAVICAPSLGPTGETIANGNLIAAAPELLDVCQRVFKFAKAVADDGDMDEEAKPLYEALRDAIAQATGEQP